MMSRMAIMFSWLSYCQRYPSLDNASSCRGGQLGTHRKCLNSLISLRVRWQNMLCSNGVIRLMATGVPDATCTAALESSSA